MPPNKSLIAKLEFGGVSGFFGSRIYHSANLNLDLSKDHQINFLLISTSHQTRASTSAASQSWLAVNCLNV